MKKYAILGLVLVAGLAAGVYWWLNREVTLVDLQKQLLFAQTAADTAKVLDRLEQHYARLHIPDSIVQRVGREVGLVLDTTQIGSEWHDDGSEDGEEIFALERRLEKVLYTAAIARGREEQIKFDAILVRAEKFAQTLARKTGIDYWPAETARIKNFTKADALAWLQAKRAAALCAKYHSTVLWQDAEKYAGLGLKVLARESDLRLRLDILQRVQVILYFFRSQHDLSLTLGQNLFRKASRLGYHLRANGVAYHQAAAQLAIGRVASAIDSLKTVVARARSFGAAMPAMSWFQINGRQRLAEAYWQLGQFENSLAMCRELVVFTLSEDEKIALYILRGLIYRSMGSYDAAKFEYQTARALADSVKNNVIKATVLTNMGFLYYILTEYDKALAHYQDALRLIETFAPSDYAARVNLFINIATASIKQGRFEAVEKAIREATMLLNGPLMLPWHKADLLLALGRFSLEIGKTKSAFAYFEEADSLCDDNNLDRLGLSAKLEVSASLKRLGRITEAKTKLDEVLRLARQHRNAEKSIEGLALLAELHDHERNGEQAIAISNRMAHEIEQLSSGLAQSDLLLSFRQKIYDFLKSAIVYEMRYGNLDSAFVKLAQAKARYLKRQSTNADSQIATSPSNDADRPRFAVKSLRALAAKSMVLDYLVMQDTLYVFVGDGEELLALRKPIVAEQLRAMVSTYKDSLIGTIALFKKPTEFANRRHFEATSSLSHELFESLMGWPELKTRLLRHDLLYLVPDEFLAEVPFGTLVSSRTDSVQFLIQQCAVLTLPSSAFLFAPEVPQSPTDLKQKRVLISVDPDFSASDDFLKFTQRRYPMSVPLTIPDSAFSRAHVLSAVDADYQIHIFFGHSVSNAADHELSYVEASIRTPSNPSYRRMKISMADLSKLHWRRSELVLLLGCETAAGKLYRGTGIMGLHQGLLAVGVEKVLASLWKTDAAFTGALAQEFLITLGESVKPAIALREAQCRAIAQLKRNAYFKYPHPYFWGGYILSTTRPE